MKSKAPVERYLVKDHITVIPETWTGLPLQGNPESLNQRIKLSKGTTLGPPMDLGVATPRYSKR